MIIDIAIIIIALLAIAAGITWMIPEQAARRKQRRWSSMKVVDRHVGGSASSLVIVERSYPLRAQADLQTFVAGVLKAHVHLFAQHGLVSDRSHQPMSMSQVLDQGEHSGASLGQIRWGSLDIGGDRPLPVLDGPTLWLIELDGRRAALLYAPVEQYFQRTGWQVALAVPAEMASSPAVERFFAVIDATLARSSCYRGKILSLSASQCGPRQQADIAVHRLAAVPRTALILPEATIRAVERNVIEHARCAAGLIARGQSARKGVLFHGPPGTGKTHCIRWLSGALPGHTILLITAEQVALLDEYMTLARLLQPALVVIEDVDLIARERTRASSPGAESLLNKLLNEMDGLREDAQITFILTTNRPEDIEPAVASRPGRVDQAILFPLPDAACRERLLGLYGQGARIDAAATAELVHRTDGASAAFIKELLRRASLNAEMRQSGETVGREDVDAALEELIGTGGTISLRLLGAVGVRGV